MKWGKASVVYSDVIPFPGDNVDEEVSSPKLVSNAFR